MCNMAAYAGKHRAAPILFEMIREQEALGGGHYTGIATICDGKIHYAKVIGSADKLAERTNALTLPGTVGIAHSRTPGIDSDDWAQPFLSCDRQVIFCGNGILGLYKDTNYGDYYMKAKAQGKTFPSYIPHEVKGYHTLPDGGCAHGGELSANYLSDLVAGGMSLAQAMTVNRERYPEEVADLALCPKEPDSVTALRVNMSLHWGRDADGYYLATSGLALDARGLNWTALVPRASVLTMSAQKIEFQSLDYYSPVLDTVTPWHKVYARLDEIFAAGGDFTVADLADQLDVLWPKGKLNESIMMTYEYLRENIHNGRLVRWMTEEKGSGAGLPAPKYRFKKSDNF